MGIDPITGAMGASVLGGLFQGSAASKQAKAQEQAANQQLALQKEVYADQTQRFQPYLDAGTNAIGAYNFLLGMGPAPTIGGTAPTIETIGGQPMGQAGAAGGRQAFGTYGRHDGAFIYDRQPQQTLSPQQFRVGGQTFNTYDDALAWANAHKTGGTQYQGFQASPGYKFQFDQGTEAINALAGAKGGLNSGRTLQDLTTFGQGLANQDWNNYLNRLSGLAGSGQAAAGMQANAGGNYAANASNALGSIGDAKASGAWGLSNAFNGTANNLIGLWQYQNAMSPAASSMAPAVSVIPPVRRI